MKKAYAVRQHFGSNNRVAISTVLDETPALSAESAAHIIASEIDMGQITVKDDHDAYKVATISYPTGLLDAPKTENMVLTEEEIAQFLKNQANTITFYDAGHCFNHINIVEMLLPWLN